jgi:tetratricopeptide (TPR) repeat protein
MRSGAAGAIVGDLVMCYPRSRLVASFQGRRERQPRANWVVGPTLRAFALAVLCLFPRQLLAADGSAREQARALVQASARQFDAGDFSGALAGFQRAYETYPSSKILFNIGLAYRKLGKNALAFLWFERFLTEGPSAGAEERNLRQARVELESLSKRVAFINVSSDVPTATVTLDGVAVGSASLPRRIPVDTGPHTLELAAGGQSRTHEFSIIAGETSQVSLPLAAPPAVAPTATSAQQPVARLPESQAQAPEPPTQVAVPGIASSSVAPTRRSWLPAARWTTALGAAGVLGVGVALNLRAMSTRKEFDGHQPETCAASGDTVVAGPPACYALAEDFQSERKYAKAAYVAGGTLALASLVFFLMDEVVPSHLALVPGVAGTPTGLSYASRF